MRLKLGAALVAVILLFFAGAGICAEATLPDVAGRGEPIDVKSEATEFRGKENLVIFTGSVVARRGNMTITSDRLEVYLKDAKNEIREIRASGNVNVRREDVLATGTLAVYLLSDDTVTLTGSPKIWRGSDAVEGEMVIMHLKEERMEIKGQARVILNPPSKKREGEE